MLFQLSPILTFLTAALVAVAAVFFFVPDDVDFEDDVDFDDVDFDDVALEFLAAPSSSSFSSGSLSPTNAPPVYLDAS